MHVAQVASLHDYYNGQARNTVYYTLVDDKNKKYLRIEHYVYHVYDKNGKIDMPQKGNQVDIKA